MSNINDLINKRSTIMSRYGLYITLLYFAVVFVAMNNIECATTMRMEYEYIKDNSIGVSVSEKDYSIMVNNKCSLTFTHNNAKYEINSQILSKSYHNGRAILTMDEISRVPYIADAKTGSLIIENINTTIANIIWMGIIKNIKF